MTDRIRQEPSDQSDLPTDKGPLGEADVITELDNLFTEDGISIPGDGTVLVLFVGGYHIRKYHWTAAEPQSRSRTDDDGPSAEFEGAEHVAIGNNVVLRFSATGPGEPASRINLLLPNQMALRYGQILALGGDFYGIPDQPISDGRTPLERQVRFVAAFKSLAADPRAVREIEQILTVMGKEINAANKAMREGIPPHEAYDRLGDQLSGEWNVITGGGSRMSPMYPLGRYLKLAARNWDVDRSDLP
jgi:hypothetical protein